jgi:predicted acyltransferase
MASDISSSVVVKEVAPAPSEHTVKSSAAPQAGEGRLVSLDTFRGFIMFWIIGGEALAAGLRALRPNAALNALLYELSHTPWQGLRFYDCIWPSFMLMAGISVPFSFAKRSRTQTYPQMLGHALTRFAVLFLLGSIRESIHFGSPYWVELSSALQPIAIASLAAFLLVRRSQRLQAAIAGSILVAYALILAFVPAHGVPAGTLEPQNNLVRSVDLMVLGRFYPDPAEPWGTVLCTLPTISTTILGLLIGEWLMSARSRESKARIIAITGVGCLAVGYGISPLVPIIMKIWTTSYGLCTAGWACLMFALFYWVVDVQGLRKGTLLFVVIGSNAVFIYMFSSIVPLHAWVRIFTASWVGASSHLEPLLRACLILAVEWVMLFWMYRNKIFIKA